MNLLPIVAPKLATSRAHACKRSRRKQRATRHSQCLQRSPAGAPSVCCLFHPKLQRKKPRTSIGQMTVTSLVLLHLFTQDPGRSSANVTVACVSEASVSACGTQQGSSLYGGVARNSSMFQVVNESFVWASLAVASRPASQ